MLRDRAQASLSDLHRLARELVAAYEHASELASSREVRQLFSFRAEEHQRFAERAGEELERLGDRPSEPDPDRRELARALRRAKVAIVRDEEPGLARELERREAELEERIDEAIRAPEIPRSALPWLEGERRRVEAMRGLLGDVGAD